MKTSTKLAVVFAALAGVAGAALSAQADSRGHGGAGDDPQMMQQAYGGHAKHGRHADGDRHGRHHGRDHHGGRMLRMMDSFDADEDGRLSQEEIDQTREQRFSAFDGDGDRSLSLAEYEKLWLDAMREAMVDRFQHLDADGDARVTAEEFKRPFAKTVRRMDRNADGVIDRDDFQRHHHRTPHGGGASDDNG